MKKTLVATYHTQDIAEQVVQKLVEQGFERGDIGLAVSEEQVNATLHAGAMVTVTVMENRVDPAMEIMEGFHPLEMDVRRFQWRKAGQRDLQPDEDEFTSIKK